MEIIPRSLLIHLKDSSHVGEVRRIAVRMSEELKLDEERSDAIAVVATELGTNVIKHAKEGNIFVTGLTNDGSRGLQLIAMDKGPGIRNISAALEDGWSSVGTLGSGLGAMRRLADRFDLYSVPGAGTVVLCEFWRKGQDPTMRNKMRLGIISTPYAGEELNGDGWTVRESGEHIVFMVVDGLGHGPLAADAAREAERIIRENQSDSPSVLLHDCHHGLAKTRGAAIGIATLDKNSGIVTYAGTGNIAGNISTSESSRGLASHNGTVGHVMIQVQEFAHPWSQDSLLILHSDGISMRWNLSRYPGIRSKHPSIVAAVIYRDFVRTRDDSTILIAANSLS